MELKSSTLLMILLVLLLPLSGCVGEDEKEDEGVDDSEQIQEEVLFEGDDIGECSDGADNDRDGMFDCDDPNCAGAPVCKLDENQNNQADNNTDEEVRNYTVPTIWEVVDLNNTILTDGAIDNAKCGLIFAWPAWDGAALGYIETLRNSISENREGEIIHVWSAIYEDSSQEVIIANIHNFLFEDDKATNHTNPYKILVENGSMIRLVDYSYNNQTGCEGEASIGLNSILQLDEPTPTCGDAIIEVSLGESCDDGNTEDGDGCSSTCQIEPQPCGDGVLDENEQCDDGNTADGDGCSSTCEQEDPCANTVCEPGWTCDNGNCMPPQDGTPCDDGDPTTVNDAYNSGQCRGQPKYCGDKVVNSQTGECECPQGQTDCNGDCVDCETDDNNCGTCGNVCTNGNICNNGQCECPQGQVNCSGECVDIRSDENNCGMCGSSCPGEGYVCNNGQCEYVGVTHYIEIANMEYQTLYLEIKRHDTVVWTNNDSVLHSVTSNDSFFDSGKISTNGDSWSFQFYGDAYGSFMYYCAYHTDMYAEIVVVP